MLSGEASIIFLLFYFDRSVEHFLKNLKAPLEDCYATPETPETCSVIKKKSRIHRAMSSSSSDDNDEKEKENEDLQENVTDVVKNKDDVFEFTCAPENTNRCSRIEDQC